MKTNLLFLAAMTLLCSACDLSAVGIGKSKKKEQYKYNLTYNGCSTGEHKFSSKDAMCDALQNNSLNNNCARDLREQHFRGECPGKTFTAF